MAVAKPTQLVEEIVETLNQMLDCGEPDEFSLRRCKQYAEKLKNEDLGAAFMVLGMIACVEYNIAEMHRCHRNSFHYAGRTVTTLTQYAVSLMNVSLFKEAYDHAFEAYKLNPDAFEPINRLVDITQQLDLMDEFLKYADLYARVTGEEHPAVICRMFDAVDECILTSPGMLVKPEPELIALAEELIEGVEVD